MQIQVIDNKLYFNNNPVYLDKGGRYSEIEYYFVERCGLVKNYSNAEIDRVAEYFKNEVARCVAENEEVDNLLEVLPCEFIGQTAKTVLDDFNKFPQELLSQVILACEDEPDDNGFRRSYWMLTADVQKYPIFSALSLFTRIRQENSRNNYRIESAKTSLTKAKNALNKATQEYDSMSLSLKDCKDEDFVKSQLNAVKEKVTKAKTEVATREHELSVLSLDMDQTLANLKGTNERFYDTLKKLLDFTPL